MISKFHWMKCSAKPITSITRCNKRLYSVKDVERDIGENVEEEKKSEFNDHNLCKTHYRILQKKKCIQLWNGSILSIDTKNKYTNISPTIELYRQLYLTSLDTEKYVQYKMNKNLRIISNGSMKIVIDALCAINAFVDRKEVYKFCKNLPKKEIISKLQFFYGIYYYYHIHTEKVLFLQRTIRQKVYFLKHKKKIITIQRYIKHKQWLQSLVVQPKRMVGVFMKNIHKIVQIQRLARKRISNIISHDCPYTLEKFVDIPKKYRISYNIKTDTISHYFFFNVKWLHTDWISQIQKKTFVINPSTKEEFPLSFIEEVSRKAWNLTRRDNDFCLQDECKETHIYKKINDWNDEFMNRSFYSKCMMILDICFFLDIEVPNIIDFYNSLEGNHFICFFREVFPEFASLLFDLSYINIYDITHTYMCYIKKKFFSIGKKEVEIGSFLFYITFLLHKVYTDIKEENIYHVIKIMFQDKFIKHFNKCSVKLLS